MAEFIVTTIADEIDGGATIGNPGGTGLSLREALVLANDNVDADTIGFAGGLSGSTIYLTQGTQLEISSDVSILGDIDGNGTGDITINANSAFGANDAASRVLDVYGSTASLDGLTITGGNGAGYGGGIFAVNSNLMISNSHISGNHTSGYGGGIEAFQSIVSVIGSTLSENSASASGGGITSVYSEIMLTNSTVSDNVTQGYAGGIENYSGALLLYNSTVSGNSAGRHSGGIFNRASYSTSIVNSTISGNSAGEYGGGIYNGGVLTLTNSTISGNDAQLSGDGIFNYGEASLRNSLLLGNGGPAGSDVYGSGTTTNPSGLSIIGGLVPADIFAALAGNGGGLLADNGGPVQTIALNADPANPALDAGDDNAAGVPLTDARGLARSDVPGVANNGANISDLGAYELQVQVNNPPVAVDDSATIDEDTTANITVLANDTDIDGDTLTATISGNPVNGSVEIVNNIAIYTPVMDFNGTDSFTYAVSDGNGGSDTGTVTVTVNPVNDAPVAADDNAAVDEDGSVTINVLANDFDVDGDLLTVTLVSSSVNGNAVLTGPSVEFTPDSGFIGDASFEYMVSDGAGGTDTATVSITVNAVNDAPVAADDAANVDEDGSVTIDVLANDSDVDGDVLTVTGVSSPANGTASAGAGGITYTPGADFNGSDSFTYTVGDGNGGTDTATVSVTVNPVNDNPLAADDAVTATIDESSNYAAATLLANDSDVDGDTLTVTAVGGGVNGSASLNGTTVTFTPDAGFTGAASFTYTVSDGNGGSDTGTVNVTVADNLPPVADAARSVTALTNTVLVFDIAASDPDGDALSFSASTPANGAVSLVGGRVTYTPATGFTGSETITVTIDDGNGGTATQDVTITTQNLPLTNQFVMFTANGFTGGAGGSGAVNGTDGFQRISVIDGPGAISLDPSFNKGGDILQLSGDASAWNITRSGSSSLFSDGDTFVTVPVGTAGLAVLFDDGVRSLKFDGSNFAIGGQAFASGTLSPITAAPDGTSLPTGADPAAKAVLFIAADAGIAASGVVDIFGAAGDELARLISGNLTLDASFNKGGDTIAFDEAASDYLASQSGSSLRLTGSDTTALIPVGTNGATLAFGDGSDTRTLLLDTTIPAITIAGQQIGIDPVQLMAV